MNEGMVALFISKTHATKLLHMTLGRSGQSPYIHTFMLGRVISLLCPDVTKLL